MKATITALAIAVMAAFGTAGVGLAHADLNGDEQAFCKIFAAHPNKQGLADGEAYLTSHGYTSGPNDAPHVVVQAVTSVCPQLYGAAESVMG